MKKTLPVAITGFDCITAAGNTLKKTVAGIDAGLSTPVLPRWSSGFAESPVFACILPETAKADIKYSRTIHLVVHALGNALAEASLSLQDLARLRVGVCLGTSVGASLNFLECCRAVHNATPPPLEEMTRFFASNLAQAIADMFYCVGPVQTVVNACSSGTDAIAIAAQWIRHELCDIAIAGGADELSEISYIGFSRLMITSPAPCAPFDIDRNGLNLGEGAGIMILESAASCRKRQVSVKGYVAGYGTCTDAYHLTAPRNDAPGLQKATQQACMEAEVMRKEVAFINAHATATTTNDAVEGDFLRKHFPHIPVVATKGSTGHTLGAAGAVEATLTLAHLIRQQLPPSPGFNKADPAIGMAPTTSVTPVHGTIALSLSLAFGGNNSALLLTLPSFASRAVLHE